MDEWMDRLDERWNSTNKNRCISLKNTIPGCPYLLPLQARVLSDGVLPSPSEWKQFLRYKEAREENIGISWYSKENLSRRSWANILQNDIHWIDIDYDRVCGRTLIKLAISQDALLFARRKVAKEETKREMMERRTKGWEFEPRCERVWKEERR